MTSKVPGEDWRKALKAIDPLAARVPVTLHAPQLLQSRGKNREAVAAFREFLGRFPDHLEGIQALGLLLRRLGRADEAAEMLARAAAVEAERYAAGDRAAVAGFLAAAAGSGAAPAAPPAAFVTGVFEDGAERFEELLRGSLQYRAPELLRAAVGDAPGDLDVLDLGCGTGLAGELFKPLARRLDGVDLSPKMLDLARAKGIYDELAEGELVAFLAACGRRYDLVIAADVLVYFGDLAPVFAGIRRVLRPGGRLAFTVERLADGDWKLRPARRYAHSGAYLDRCAADAGFAATRRDEVSTRVEATLPVPGLACVWQTPPA